MTLPSPPLVALAFLAFEATISLTRTPMPGAQAKDRGTFQMIWIGIALAIALGMYAETVAPTARVPAADAIHPYALALFVLGAILRAWSIRTLGRFFTVQVAIASDHRLIQDGPYRLLRHPSYTGSLTMFLGWLLYDGNALLLGIVLVTVLALFVHRIRVEEAALAETFGDDWRDYCARTWRLVPLVY